MMCINRNYKRNEWLASVSLLNEHGGKKVRNIFICAGRWTREVTTLAAVASRTSRTVHNNLSRTHTHTQRCSSLTEIHFNYLLNIHRINCQNIRILLVAFFLLSFLFFVVFLCRIRYVLHFTLFVFLLFWIDLCLVQASTESQKNKQTKNTFDLQVYKNKKKIFYL